MTPHRSLSVARLLIMALVTSVALATGACGGPPAPATAVDIAKLRDRARSSTDGEVVGRWLLDEMVSPGGTAKGAEDARNRLLAKKTTGNGLFAAAGGALWDELHGEPRRAAQGYVAAITHAKSAPRGSQVVSKSGPSSTCGERCGPQTAILQRRPSGLCSRRSASSLSSCCDACFNASPQ